jgi:hypothetical protein
MGKVIATFNMTLDGVCDNTTGIPSEDLYQHYSDLLYSSGVILYGRPMSLCNFGKHYCKILLVKINGRFCNFNRLSSETCFLKHFKGHKLGQCRTFRHIALRKSIRT